MSHTQDIVQKLWNLCNILKDDGVTYQDYVTELTFLLFLKTAQETNREAEIPEGYRWADLETKNEAVNPQAFHYWYQAQRILTQEHLLRLDGSGPVYSHQELSGTADAHLSELNLEVLPTTISFDRNPQACFHVKPWQPEVLQKSVVYDRVHARCIIIGETTHSI